MSPGSCASWGYPNGRGRRTERGSGRGLMLATRAWPTEGRSRQHGTSPFASRADIQQEASDTREACRHVRAWQRDRERRRDLRSGNVRWRDCRKAQRRPPARECKAHKARPGRSPLWRETFWSRPITSRGVSAQSAESHLFKNRTFTLLCDACPCRKLTPSNIGGVVRPERAPRACDRQSEQHAGSARPCAAIGAYELRCNIFGRN